jgi:hypothetical protein
MVITPNASLVALVGLFSAFCAQGAGLLIWGARLTERVKAVEESNRSFVAVSGAVSELRGRMDGIIDQLTELNQSIRWMRDPAPAAIVRRSPRKDTP